MEHVTGNIGQTVVQDFGAFVTVLNLRVRKDLVTAYCVGGPIPNAESAVSHTVNIMFSSGWNATKPTTKEECEHEVERLDWIYKKETST